MMRNLWILVLTTSLMLGITDQGYADESIANKIVSSVRIQGTIVGQGIAPAAILDDLIAREGDTFLIDAETGRLVARLFEKEIDNHPANLKVKIVSIAHGAVVLEYEGTNLSLAVGPRGW